jgi:hypothetical protein
MVEEDCDEEVVVLPWIVTDEVVVAKDVVDNAALLVDVVVNKILEEVEPIDVEVVEIIEELSELRKLELVDVEVVEVLKLGNIEILEELKLVDVPDNELVVTIEIVVEAIFDAGVVLVGPVWLP